MEKNKQTLRSYGKSLAPLEIRGREKTAKEEDVRRKYEVLTKTLIEKRKTITTMESCTSGQIASLITDTEGSSAVLKGAFVTYSNAAKIMQGVPKEIIETYSVYSSETAAAMAETARNAYQADYSLGITGCFGNADPGNAEGIPGEVYFAIAEADQLQCFHCTVPHQKTRYLYKLYMADVIADEILKCL